MKITQLAFLIVLAALLNACKKSSDDNPTTTKLKYLTQQIIVDSTGSGTSTFNITYTYDDKKRLISSKNGTTEFDYAYNDAGNVYSTTSTSTVTTPDKHVREFTYADGKVSTEVERVYTKNNLVATNNYGFVYNGGNLTEVHADGGISGAGITLYYYDSNNNISKTDVNAGYLVTNITYDNKKSPYTNWQQTLKNVAVSSLEVCSPNNTVSLNNVNGTQTYNYTYDSDGYPTGRIIRSPHQTTKYAYIYTEF